MTAEHAQGRRAGAPFVLMVKPVGARCNLSCRYCYYLGTDARLGQPAEGCMSEETLEALIRNYMESSPGPVVSFTWHGGEPALAGLDFYRRIAAGVREHIARGGMLILECGEDQAQDVLKIFSDCDYAMVVKDLAGKERIVKIVY